MVGSHDPFDYCPLQTGTTPASKAGLRTMLQDGSMKTRIFQIDDKFDVYRKNKEACRTENLQKYYKSVYEEDATENQNTIDIAIYFMNKMVEEYPEHFKIKTANGYRYLTCNLTDERLVFDKEGYRQDMSDTKFDYADSLDALAMQVPEDFTVHRMEDGADFVSDVHLCHANGWNAEWAVGKSFRAIHEGVANMETIVKNQEGLVRAMAKYRNVAERVGAISFRGDTVLNRHPEATDKETPVDKDNFFMRYERETIIPFPKQRAFVFTIKTYFNDCMNLGKKYKQALIDTFENPDDKVYASSFVTDNRKEILGWLK